MNSSDCSLFFERSSLWMALWNMPTDNWKNAHTVFLSFRTILKTALQIKIFWNFNLQVAELSDGGLLGHQRQSSFKNQNLPSPILYKIVGINIFRVTLFPLTSILSIRIFQLSWDDTAVTQKKFTKKCHLIVSTTL